MVSHCRIILWCVSVSEWSLTVASEYGVGGFQLWYPHIGVGGHLLQHQRDVILGEGVIVYYSISLEARGVGGLLL